MKDNGYVFAVLWMTLFGTFELLFKYKEVYIKIYYGQKLEMGDDHRAWVAVLTYLVTVVLLAAVNSASWTVVYFILKGMLNAY